MFKNSSSEIELGVAFVIPREPVRTAVSAIFNQEIIAERLLEQPKVEFTQLSLQDFLFENDNTIQKLTYNRSTLLFEPTLEGFQ